MTLDGTPFGEFKGRWTVAQVKPFPPKNEKMLARELAARGIGYFLPMERLRRGTRIFNRVLFPGYLFFSGSDGDRYEVVRTTRTVRIIDVLSCARQAQLRQQLQYIYDGLIAGHTFTPPPVTIGCRARIDSNVNPFQSYEGIVAEKIDGRQSYKVIIEFFGRKLPIEVAADELERM